MNGCCLKQSTTHIKTGKKLLNYTNRPFNTIKISTIRLSQNGPQHTKGSSIPNLQVPMTMKIFLANIPASESLSSLFSITQETPSTHKGVARCEYCFHAQSLCTFQKHDSILMVVLCFSKMAHFILCSKTLLAT